MQTHVLFMSKNKDDKRLGNEKDDLKKKKQESGQN